MGWWFTGLVDGEGCFYSTLSLRQKKTPSGSEYPCINLDAGLQIWLRADDKAALEKIRDYFGFGDLQSKPVNQARKIQIPGSKPATSLRLRDLDLLVERVIPHFTEFPLQTKKMRDYEVWRELIEFVYTKLHGHKGWRRRFPEEVAKVSDLCARLKEVRVYSEAS